MDKRELKRIKRARREAMKAFGAMKRGGFHKNPKAYNRKAKFGKDWE